MGDSIRTTTLAWRESFFLPANPISTRRSKDSKFSYKFVTNRCCTCFPKFSGANRDREILNFPFQLTTTRIIGNVSRLILTLAICVTIHIHVSVV